MKLNDTQRRWSTIEREAFATLSCLQKYRFWLFKSKVIIHSAHNCLLYLTETAPKSSKLMRWALAIQEYDVVFKYQSGSTNTAADFLSRVDYSSLRSTWLKGRFVGNSSGFCPCSGSFVNTNGFVCVFWLLVRNNVNRFSARWSGHFGITMSCRSHSSRVSRQVLPTSGFFCEGEDAIKCCWELTLRLMSLVGLFWCLARNILYKELGGGVAALLTYFFWLEADLDLLSGEIFFPRCDLQVCDKAPFHWTAIYRMWPSYVGSYCSK